MSNACNVCTNTQREPVRERTKATQPATPERYVRALHGALSRPVCADSTHSIMVHARAVEISPIRPRQNLDSPAHDAAITRRVYKPPRERSSACVPFSTTRPSLSTAMLSALRMVDSRCAMTSVVRRVSATTASSAACTTRSLSLSSADVASSSTRIGGSRTSARAMAIRCFCPPDSWTPRSPTMVSNPRGKASTKASALAVLAAARTSSSAAAGLPYAMLSRIEQAKRTGSCATSATCFRHHEPSMLARGTPSRVMLPRVGSYHRSSSPMTVDLPEPEGPQSATTLPGSMRRLTPSRTSASGRAGYEKLTSERWSWPRTRSGLSPSASGRAGEASSSAKTRDEAPSAFMSEPNRSLRPPRQPAMTTVYRRKEVSVPRLISPAMTSAPPYHSTPTTANWPVVPMRDPKAPYASAFFLPKPKLSSTAPSYRSASRGSFAKLRTVRMPEKHSCATSAARASAAWYCFENRFMNRP
mmetsp:Transcript_26370/g.84820  ORF Transcript_26370/g.84820 Transcript_26370/m.84820 type:complete len:473 (+) Transcript_26370:3-1421(+)